MSSKYRHPGNSLTFVAPSGGVTAGVFAVIGGIGLVPETTAAEGESFQGQIVGVHALPKVGSQAWVVGDKVYWDAGNSRFTKTATDGPLMGIAAGAVGSGAGETTGAVRLNGVSQVLLEGIQASIVDLTDSTGGSGTHDDTLAAPSVPADITGGESPTEAEHNAALAAMRIINQNTSDLAQKVKELIALLDTLGATA